LPFSEIHFDYYQIPVEDKEKLLKALEAERVREEQRQQEQDAREAAHHNNENAPINISANPVGSGVPEGFSEKDIQDLVRAEEIAKQFALEVMGEEYYNEKYGAPKLENEERIEEELEEQTPVSEERRVSSLELYKQYKIQEVIKRNQIVLIQIVKEERGSKGAALTTYLALAGRYCVFMPNTDKGGGVSRRISNYSERRRIRDIIKQLDSPEGTSVIIRTAGMEREFADIKKDHDYLLSVWDNIRKQTLKSTAPSLVYEESDIVKRSLRDMLKADVSEVYIEGEDTFKSAYKFMEIVAPNQLEMLKQYVGKIPIFQKFKIEEKLDELYDTEVKLESGGSIVITPTEALVSIDVNSGKSTRERNVEDTALRTNLEAAREIARHLNQRDLAGLIVIDFIDMREVRNRKAIERELKEALKADKAKIQIGRISAFGLLEMSRQRLRSSLVESSSSKCPMCRGIGVVRTNESLTLKAIRSIEAEAGRRAVKEIFVRASQAIAHNLEHKRSELSRIEENAGTKIVIEIDVSLLPNQFEISTSKYSSRQDRQQKAERVEAAPKAVNRPIQEAANDSMLPSENPASIDADVDEQIVAWQSEPVEEPIDEENNIEEKLPEKRHSHERGERPERTDRAPRPRGEYKGNRTGGQRNDRRGGRNNAGGGQQRSEGRTDNRNGEQQPRVGGGERNDRRPRGGRNGRNDRRPGPGGGRNTNYRDNFDGNNFGNEQNNAPAPNYNEENYAGKDKVERIDSYQKQNDTIQPQQNAVRADDKTPEQKVAASKLIGLWKKITS